MGFMASWPRRTDGLRKGLLRKSSFAEVHDQSQRRGLRTSHLVTWFSHRVVFTACFCVFLGSPFARSQRAMVSSCGASYAEIQLVFQALQLDELDYFKPSLLLDAWAQLEGS